MEKLIVAIIMAMTLLPSLVLGLLLVYHVAHDNGAGRSCRHGYTSSGSFCVPSQGAQEAIPLPPSGTCPHGWTRSGSYCLRSGSGR